MYIGSYLNFREIETQYLLNLSGDSSNGKDNKNSA